jgi:hypothetical protein
MTTQHTSTAKSYTFKSVPENQIVNQCNRMLTYILFTKIKQYLRLNQNTIGAFRENGGEEQNIIKCILTSIFKQYIGTNITGRYSTF